MNTQAMVEPTLGRTYVNDPTKVDLAVWRYVLVDGAETGYVRREKGRSVDEVFSDVSYEARELLAEVEYASVSCQCDRNMEIPPYRRVACYAVTGANEGHYVHVDLHTTDGATQPLFLFKTFMGMDHAWAIARKVADLLDA